MNVDDIKMKQGFRNGWILVGLAVVFVIGFWCLAFMLNRTTSAPGWDLDDRPIVPASSIDADGYLYKIDPRYGRRQPKESEP